MEDDKARTDFLSAVLGFDPKDIRDTRILIPYLRKHHNDDKLGILDVRVLMNNDTEIDTEIQLVELKVWADRSLFYLAKMYSDQIDPGQDYNLLKKCVSISILDFDLFKGETEFYSRFHLREDTRGFIYTDKMEFHIIELPKLPAQLMENSRSIELWGRFISSERKEDFDMLAQKAPYIESTYERLQVISQDKQKRIEYEAREKAVRDYNQTIYEAEQREEQRVNKLHSLLIQQNQEGEGFNCHYQAHDYHPLLCYDGLTGALLKAELRDGTMYCSKEADLFM